ncbi:uncharacterized protein LOC144643421 [Oculina patagonica]
MESPREENEENRRPDRETPRAAPENQATPEDIDLVRKLLAEVAEIRKENQQLKSEVSNLKTKTRRRLFQRSKDSDSECSNAVRKVWQELTRQEDQENQLEYNLNTRFNSPSNQAMAKKVVKEVQSVYGKKKMEKGYHKSCRSTTLEILT